MGVPLGTWWEHQSPKQISQHKHLRPLLLAPHIPRAYYFVIPSDLGLTLHIVFLKSGCWWKSTEFYWIRHGVLIVFTNPTTTKCGVVHWSLFIRPVNSLHLHLVPVLVHLWERWFDLKSNEINWRMWTFFLGCRPTHKYTTKCGVVHESLFIRLVNSLHLH
jgi:hypothetical protein